MKDELPERSPLSLLQMKKDEVHTLAASAIGGATDGFVDCATSFSWRNYILFAVVLKSEIRNKKVN